MHKCHQVFIAEHEDIVASPVIIEVFPVFVSIEKYNVPHGMHSCLDTNVRNYFVTEKWLKQGIRSQKKGKQES